jgi:hypothetical protein
MITFPWLFSSMYTMVCHTGSYGNAWYLFFYWQHSLGFAESLALYELVCRLKRILMSLPPSFLGGHTRYEKTQWFLEQRFGQRKLEFIRFSMDTILSLDTIVLSDSFRVT